MSGKKDLSARFTRAGEPEDAEFFQSIADLIRQARHELEKTVNTAMVVTYYEIGRRIIEKEQQGAIRAQYGKRVLQGLSEYLTANLGKGYFADNLRLMRQFYLVYSGGAKSETPFPKCNLSVSWSHYIQLMRIKNPDERSFYEIEIANNNWSLKEFER
jgi:hypothetical protein